MEAVTTFADEYATLERAFRRQTDDEGSVYYPVVEPRGPVDYVAVCMEPSLKGGFKGADDARTKIALGYRNFVTSFEDFLLQYALREFLCAPGETYHITDISKGAMTVREAGKGREARYQRWASLLQRELELVLKSGAPVIAVGNQVHRFLQRSGVPGLVESPLMHYSPQTVPSRPRLIEGRLDEFAEFQDAVRKENVQQVADGILNEAEIPPEFAEIARSRLRRGDLTAHRSMLLFGYRDALGRIRDDRNQAT